MHKPVTLAVLALAAPVPAEGLAARAPRLRESAIVADTAGVGRGRENLLAFFERAPAAAAK